jgi:hypothetical protein
MTTQFPIVFEREDSGVISAYVPGLPVYAEGATQRGAERAVQRTLEAYLEVRPNACVSECHQGRNRTLPRASNE